MNYYSMYIYGICSKCAHAKRMELRRLERESRVEKLPLNLKKAVNQLNRTTFRKQKTNKRI